MSNSPNPGKIIAAFGIPGSGKSSTIKALGELLNIQTFHEPEEGGWPKAVTDRQISGNFTAIMWFRSIRVPLLYEANELKKSGNVVMLDSFYDKLFALYMSTEGIQWLFDYNDSYREEMEMIARKDYNNLPDVDCVIFFNIDYTTWHSFLESRNRNLDNESEFRKQCFNSQQYFLEAVKQYSNEKNCELIICNQEFGSPEKTALKLAEALKRKSII